ncbi:solute carrier family 15 member 1 isoform X2 [Parasteatoda tepidariorum]|uniref:solute carrier family 15 member 1 isoform X2 n=1 Tax=Parasteatoda tepidariorum TaxID=114398 RepID=UPI001C71ED39|nr:solute carrier family 15 member 1 isoform X2 [Parasteatoda tepidariorum]
MTIIKRATEKTQLLDKDLKLDVESNSDGERKYPKSVFFILGNEFCERFCFYGMRTILMIYFTKQLLYSENTSTMLYHLFVMLAYFTPVLGAIISDSWLGKFRTILYVSIIYVIGNIVLSVGAFPFSLDLMRTVSLLGLVVIGIGTGGIKPCVSAFGGDQFHRDQVQQRERFFSIFYFMINCGSVFSTLLTPVLRSESCMGQETCFPLAFGVPAALMVVALILFLLGKPLYIIEQPKGNVLTSVVGCMFHAIKKKFSSSEKKKDHWLDYAEDKYDKKLIADIKIVLHILVLYIPLPIFWALFDQTGSRWTLQATKMDGEFFGTTIKPDQLQAANPILILIFIPLFDYVVYPVLGKCRLLTKPLQRITIGGLLAAVSFVVAGFLELGVESTLPVLPQPGFSELTIMNLNPCTVNITEPEHYLLKANETHSFRDLKFNDTKSWTFMAVEGEPGCDFQKTVEITNKKSIQTAFLLNDENQFDIQIGADEKSKSKEALAKVRIFFSIKDIPINATFKFVGPKTYFVSPDNETGSSDIGRTDYASFEPGNYKFYLPFNESSHLEDLLGEAKFQSGGSYIVGIVKSDEHSNLLITTLVLPNSVPILLQIPQYVILTAAEIMFSITGLEFSYSQAPLSMKSVLQAAWLLTVAFGNLIVTIVAETELVEKKSSELFMFAILMGIDMLIFAVMAYFYKYVKVHTYSEERSGDKSRTNTTNGKVNDAYVEETDFTK